MESLWAEKLILEPDEHNFIEKHFRDWLTPLSFFEQQELLDKKSKYFGKYMPLTFLCERDNWTYIIRQEFIKWKRLSDVNINNLSANTLTQLLDLINKYIKYGKEEKKLLDYTWHQEYPDNPPLLIRKLRTFLKVNKNFLISTNIMISDDWNVYMVDLCETKDYHENFTKRIKNFCSKPFIKKTISELEEVLKMKKDEENKK